MKELREGQSLRRILSVISVASLLLLLFFMTRNAGVPTVAVPESPLSSAKINDVTGMNLIAVVKEVAPTSLQELQQTIRAHQGSISVGGARFSMGGQIGAENSLHIDMRRLNQIISLDVEKRQITVQAGATWRSVQEAIDPYDLSVKVMQSYSNFTVGGSLSVNVHGRYVREGSILGTVRSIRVVLADGTIVDADRDHKRDLFYGCIGGYGALGVIAEATLDLAHNSTIKRTTELVPLKRYTEFFRTNIRADKRVVLQNGDLLSGGVVNSVSWKETKKPLSTLTRLAPIHQEPTVAEKLTATLILDVPFGRYIRRYLEPYRYRDSPVVSRNFEAGYDVSSLGPISGPGWTFALEEYFVPIGRLEAFAEAMTRVLSTHRVDYLNISIRHAMPDVESYLSWAPREAFTLVLYYRQKTAYKDREEVGRWTRKLIDEVLSHGGSYFLPYQIHATKSQFLKAYPRAKEFFVLKERLDPQYKFRNKLWDAYYRIGVEQR